MLLRYYTDCPTDPEVLALNTLVHSLNGHVYWGSHYIDITVCAQYHAWLLIKYPTLQFYSDHHSQQFREITVQIGR